jgi:hypothetical protein
MITPKFHLSQDEVFVYVHMYLPHVHLEGADVAIDGNQVYRRLFFI